MFLKEYTATQTMQVKQFISNDPADAARALAEWLETSDAEICQLAQSQSEKQGRFLFVITVLYR